MDGGSGHRSCPDAFARCGPFHDAAEQSVLVRAAAVEAEGAFGLWLDGVAVFGCDRVDAEVPYAEVDFAIAEDFDEGVLAEGEGLAGGEFEPVASGEGLGGGFDEIFLALRGAELRKGEAGDDPGVGANVDADDDVAAGGGASGAGRGGAAGRAAGVDGEGAAPARGWFVADANIKDGVLDVELDGGAKPFELSDLVSGRAGIDDALEDIVCGVAVKFAGRLGEGNELGGGLKGVEGEDTVLLGEGEIGCDLGCEGGPICFFLEDFRVDGGFGFRVGAGDVLVFPGVGGVDVDEGEGDDLLGAAALGAGVDNVFAFNAIAGDDLVAAVPEDEMDAMREGGIGGRLHRKKRWCGGGHEQVNDGERVVSCELRGELKRLTHSQDLNFRRARVRVEMRSL